MATAVELERAHGAGHGDDHGYADHPPTSTGLDHRKLLMWAFLASDCMFFGSLIATYMIYRGRAEDLGFAPFPSEILDIPYTSLSAFVLLMSSLTMVLALAAIQKGDHRGLRIWLAATALLGAIFLGGQYFEFTEFYHEGLSLQTNMFGASFFVLTGFHGAHVTIGVIWLLTLLFLSLRGGVKQEDSLDVELAGLYWHFVDIVWIVIFTLVYLIPYDEVTETQTGAFTYLAGILRGVASIF
ncbi:MAG: heme-copper oxidase subunit III [Chloroflexota bacterium]|nr:heme-copper oxidase subunit III [Chloroflexota bacterium]MDP9472467.1 heme-copper oxidase subunit III [Chloroflexota bacterium]